MTAHELIEILTAAKLHFSMATVRENAVMFEILVPGERWEAEVFSDGRVELEVFASGDEISDQSALLARIEQFKD